MPLNRWAFGLVVFLCLGVVSWAYQETFLSLHNIWTENNHTYSHGYVLLAFSIYAMYIDRRWLIPSPSFSACLLGLVIGALWFAAVSVQVRLVQQMLVPVIIFYLLISIVGFRNAFKAAVPVFSLYLAIPVADFFLDPLQDLTTFIVSIFVRLSGITAFIDGYDIHLPYGVMRIADGCAGLNYMLAGVCMGVFYGYLNLQMWRHKVFALLLIAIFALVGNWIRVYLLIMIGYYSEMQSSLVHEHGFFGWVTFAILLAIYFFLMEWFTRKYTNNTTEVQAPKLPKFTTRNYVALSLAVFTLVLFPLYKSVQTNKSLVVEEFHINVPDGFVVQSNDRFSAKGVNFTGSDFNAVYSKPLSQSVATLFVSSYMNQAQGKELIYFANTVGNQLEDVSVIKGELGPVNIAKKRKTDGYVLWVFKVAEDTAIGDLQTKLLQLKHSLDGGPSSALVLHIDCNKQCDKTVSKTELELYADMLYAISVKVGR